MHVQQSALQISTVLRSVLVEYTDVYVFTYLNSFLSFSS
jgi:hypothetical protein